MVVKQGVEKVNEMVHQANVQLFDIWREQMLFTWRWWLSVALVVGPWVLWVVLRKKESTDRLLYAGLVTALISTYLDTIGMALGLWTYEVEVIPLIPPYIPWDLCVIPVITMFALQIKPRLNPVLKALIIATLGVITEEIFELTGLYDAKHWQHYHSFPIFFIMFLIAYYVSSRSKFKKL